MNRISRRYSGRFNRPICVHEQLVIDKDAKSAKIVSAYPVREDGTVIELDVDQFSGQSFMTNPNGFIMNDIMMFEECQSDSVARAVLNRLKVLHPQSLDQRMTLDQMMAHCVPSNYGSPAEFVSANKSVAEKCYKLYEQDYKAYQVELQKQADARMQQEQADISKSVPNPE